MLNIPRAVDRKAREVGTQERKAEEKLIRYWLVGVQCSGRLAQVPRRDDRDIVAFDVFRREGVSDEYGPWVCYCIRGYEAVKRCLLGLVTWSDARAAAELTAVYGSSK